MALQRIDWSQIDTIDIPSGHTVDIGAVMTPTVTGIKGPVHSVNTNNLSILGIDFFDYLKGYTGGSPSTVTVENNGGLRVTYQSTGTTLATAYNTALDPTLATPATVGGIPAGTTVEELSGKTFVEFVDELLFPIVLPSYTIPAITMTGVASQIYEVGRSFTPSINVYGDKNDAGSFIQLRILRNGSPIFTDITLSQSSIGDISSQFGYTDPNNPNYRYTISPTPYSESYIIPAGVTIYNGDGNYNAGASKQNNKGNYDSRTPVVRSSNAPQAAGNNYGTTAYTITGIYPYFYGTSLTLPTPASIAAAILSGSVQKVLSDASGTLAIPYNNPSTWLYIWFAYPDEYTTKIKWWVNALDNGDIDGSFITPVVTQAVNSPDGYWTGKSFKMHWSVYQTQQNTIEFRDS